MPIIDLKNATITLSDRADHFIFIYIGQGNLQYTSKRNLEFVKSRGFLNTVREGDDEPVEVSLQFVWETLVGGSDDGDPPTFDAVLRHYGHASSWLSTNPDSEAPYCIDIEVQYIPICNGVAGTQQTLILQQFNYEELSHSLSDATVDCKGKCNIVGATYFEPA